MCSSRVPGAELMLEMMLKKNPDINLKDSKKGRCALYYAAFHGGKEGVRMLLKYGADTEIVTDDGLTPLIVAAQEGKARAVTTCRLASAQISRSSRQRYLPLMFFLRLHRA